MLLCIYPSKILNIASVCGDYDAEQNVEVPNFYFPQTFLSVITEKPVKKIPLALWQRETLASWPWSLDGHAYVRELLCCFETLIYTLTWSKHGWPVRSRLKAQTADQIQKWNQSAEAGSPDHKGNQCVRSAGRVLWQQFSQDTCFNKTWINTMDVLHTSWVSFLIKFTDQPVIVSRPAGVIQCTVWWWYTWL